MGSVALPSVGIQVVLLPVADFLKDILNPLKLFPYLLTRMSYLVAVHSAELGDASAKPILQVNDCYIFRKCSFFPNA